VNFHPFSWIWQHIGAPLDAMTNATSTALLTWIRPGVTGSAVLALSFLMMYAVLLKGGDIIHDWLGHLIRLLLVVSIIGSAFFQPAVNQLFLHGVPESLIRKISAATGTTIPTGDVSQAFDVSWVDAMAAGMKVKAAQTGWSASAIGTVLLALAYMAAATLAIFATYGVWFITQFILHLVVATAPIGLAAAAYSKTKHVFESWLGVMFGLVLLQGLVWFALSVVIGLEGTLVHSILTMDGNAADRAGADTVMLILGACIYGLFAWALKHLPGLAMQLIGGAQMVLDGVVRSAMSGPIYAAGAAAESAGRGAGATASWASNTISPPGRPFLGATTRTHL